MVNNDLSHSNHSTRDRGCGSMVLDSRTYGNLCRSSDPDRNYGRSTGSRQVGDCCLVTPELEEDLLVDEVLSDISSVCADGNHQSGYLRFSLQGTS